MRNIITKILSINKKILIPIGIVLFFILIFGLRSVGRSNNISSQPQEEVSSEQNSQESFESSSYPDSSIKQTNINSQSKLSAEEEQKIAESQDVVIDKTIQKTERGDILFNNSKDFQLIYFSKEDAFLIAILSTDFETGRTKAETTFLNTLGIDKTLACKLTVYVSTVSSTNEEINGKIFGLSFCN
jgi:hypothetical protein